MKWGSIDSATREYLALGKFLAEFLLPAVPVSGVDR